MRVMHIISCLVKTDGHSLFCMRLAERLHAQGHAQTIFTLPSGGEELPDSQSLVQHADGRLLRFLNVSFPFGLERQIAALALFFKPDVIHLHGGWHPVLFFGACVARRLGVPILLSLHGSLRPAVVEDDRRLKKRLAWSLYQRRLIQMASMIHVSTETEKEDLARLGFHKPIAVVPNGVDFEDFSRKGAKAQRGDESEDGGQRTEDGERSSFVHYCERAFVERREVSKSNGSCASDDSDSPHGLTNSQTHELPCDAARTRTVLYLGRVHPLKGLDLLIEAWRLVKISSLVHYFDSSLVGSQKGRAGSTNERMNSRTNELLSWQLVIAGPDESGHKAELVEEAKRLGLRVEDGTTHERMNSRTNELLPDLVFIGPVYGERKARLLSEADLFVLPTRSDNFGIAVAEALASGVPVISTKGAPWSELLGNSDSSFVHYCESALVGENQVPKDRSQRTERLVTHELTNSRTNELARSGRAGWWVDIGVEPLAAALREALSLTDGERRALGENGRRLVERKYRWETVAEQMTCVYGILPANLRE